MSLRDDREFYTKSEYIITDTQNKVSRKSTICGSQNIVLGGRTIVRPSVILRGDLRRTGSGQAVAIVIGKYCYLGDGCVIRPPYKTYKGVFSFYPVKLGDYVSVGAGTILEAASVGNMVEIGKNCVVGKFTVIKDCARIEDNTIIAPGTVVPSMSVFGGSPGKAIDELPESSAETIEAQAVKLFTQFQVA